VVASASTGTAVGAGAAVASSSGVQAFALFADAGEIIATGEAWVIPGGVQALAEVGAPEPEWPVSLVDSSKRARVPFYAVRAVVDNGPEPAYVPFYGIRAVVPELGDDMKPIRTFELYTADREIYEIDFDAKYLSGVNDTAHTLDGFSASAGITAAPEVSVNDPLSSGVVRFSASNPTGTGPYTVSVRIATVGGRKKTGIVTLTKAE